MLNPISVSFNSVQKNMFGKNYQTNPIGMQSLLKADTFVRSNSVANVSFTSVDNTIVGKSIRGLGDVPCPYCGIRVINGKEISHLNKENLGGTSKQAIQLLKPFEDRMHPVEKQVFNLLESLSVRKPKKNLRQLLDKVRPEHLEILKQQEYDILNRMSDYNDKNVKDKQNNEKVDKLLHEAVDIITKQDENYIFRRRRFMEKLNNITNNMADKDSAKGLQNIAEELPRAHDNMSAFIIKFTQKDAKTKLEKTPYQIGISLVEPSVGSLEHVKPRHPKDKSEGGENLYSNYIYASKEWNTRRRNTPLNKWIEKNPQIKGYMQTYIDEVIKRINSGKALQNCKVYPIIIAKTIEKESKGLVKLDTSKLKLSKKEISQGLKNINKQEEQIKQKTQAKSEKNSSKTTAKKHLTLVA